MNYGLADKRAFLMSMTPRTPSLPPISAVVRTNAQCPTSLRNGRATVSVRTVYSEFWGCSVLGSHRDIPSAAPQYHEILRECGPLGYRQNIEEACPMFQDVGARVPYGTVGIRL